MKIRLSKEQTNYMNGCLQMLLSAIVTRKDLDEPSARALYKMRYKFAPNSLDIYLTRVERSILASLLSYRAQQLTDSGSITEESEIVSELIRRIQG